MPFSAGHMPSVECLGMLINSGNFQTAADVDLRRAFVSVHKGIKAEIEELKEDIERASEDRAARLIMELQDERKEYERLRMMYDASVMQNKQLAAENLALLRGDEAHGGGAN